MCVRCLPRRNQTGLLLNMAAHGTENRSFKTFILEHNDDARSNFLIWATRHWSQMGLDSQKKTKEQIDGQAAQQIAFEATPRHFGPNMSASSSSLLPDSSVSNLDVWDLLTSKPGDANLSDDDISFNCSLVFVSSSSDESSSSERNKRKTKPKKEAAKKTTAAARS